jgi:hypothetical protein
MKRTCLIATAVFALAIGAFAQEAQAPPPQAPQEAKDAKYTNESIARLSFVDGKAFVQRASDLGYEEAALNMPISEGDRISTSEGRVEVHFGRANYLRLDDGSKVDILNLPKKEDETARIRIWSGRVYLVVGTLKKEKSIELHTADSSFYVLDRGVYRVDVRENRDTEIQVHQGLIEVAGGEGSTLLKASQRLEISEGRFASKPSSFIAVANDGFDRFNESRAAVTGREIAQNRLPEELSDFEGDLEENGEWVYLPPYGNVWVPDGVDEDWRPYYNGRWTWLPLSGWTWWPYDPWGWPTFHYGRWHWGIDIGWYWIPMSLWGPGWVNWWWDDYYFGWAPLSYWGYPGVIFGGIYYGNYYGPYYPYQSRALTVVRRDQLRDPHISQNALRGDALKSLNRMSLTSRSLSLKPSGTKISVQPVDGGRVLLRNSDKGTGLTPDRRIARPGAAASGGPSTSTGPRAIRKPDDPGKSSGKTGSTAAKPQSIKSPSAGQKSGSAGKSSGSSGRNIRKKDDAPAASQSASAARATPTAIPRPRPSPGPGPTATTARAGPGRIRVPPPGRPRGPMRDPPRAGRAARAGPGWDHRHREDREACREARLPAAEARCRGARPPAAAPPRAALRAGPEGRRGAAASAESSNPFPSGGRLSSVAG